MTRILALIVDYHTTTDAEFLSYQLATHAAATLEAHPGLFSIQIVHIDNGNSPPVTLSSRQREFAIQSLTTGKNLGYGGALHFAIQQYAQSVPAADHAGAYDAYWFLNADLEIDSECLPQLVRVLNQHPAVGAIGPLVREYSRRNRTWGARGKISPWLGTTAMTDWQVSGPLPRWSYIPGCSLLVRAQAYHQVGGLPTQYHLYYEETDFCVQLQRQNWILWVERTAVAYHKVDSMKDRIPARHFAYYFTRNNLLFWKKCFQIPIWFQIPRTLFVLFKEVLLPLRRARSWDLFFDRLKYAKSGMIDGIRLAQGRPLIFEKNLFWSSHAKTSPRP